jgi:copper chaperone CopZ
MRRAGTTLIVAVAWLVSCAVLATVKTSAFRVEGMNNEVAVKRVTDSVRAVRGVQEAVASASSAILMVRYDNAVVSAVDLAEAVGNAGYTLGSVEGSGGQAPKDPNLQKAKVVLTDFAQVQNQTLEFIEKDRYGLVRNLAQAMKVRRDAVLSFEKTTAPTRRTAGQANTLQLAQNLSAAVDKFVTAAEARDKAAAKDTFRGVSQTFKALADARNFDDLVAPPVTTAGQPSTQSIQEQLQDYITKVLGGK